MEPHECRTAQMRFRGSRDEKGSRQAAREEELLFIISVCAAAKAFARHLEICSHSIDLQAYAETFERSARFELWPVRAFERAK
jgi:hypothetical protein